MEFSDNDQVEVVIQFHVNHVNFCNRHDFTEEKTSCFIEIMQYVLTHMIEERPTEEASFALFKELLLRHSV